MKNKVKILEFGTLWPLSVDVIKENVKDRNFRTWAPLRFLFKIKTLDRFVCNGKCSLTYSFHSITLSE